MLTVERHAVIINMIKEQEVVKLCDIVEATSASESTIRRDLVELEEMQKLKRVHGGASAIQGKASELGINEKTSKNIQSKRHIAKIAAEQIEDEDCIYLDAGSTTLEMIPFLQNKNITVVTNGLTQIEELEKYNIQSYILGGMLKGHTKAIIGSMAAENLRNYRFDKCFLGINGVHTEYGYTTPDIEEALMKKTALAMSEKAYVLADCSKFSEISFAKVADIDEAMIITDLVEHHIEDYEKKTTVIKVVMK